MVSESDGASGLTTATLSSAGCGSRSIRASAPCSASVWIFVLSAGPLPEDGSNPEAASLKGTDARATHCSCHLQCDCTMLHLQCFYNKNIFFSTSDSRDATPGSQAARICQPLSSRAAPHWIHTLAGGGQLEQGVGAAGVQGGTFAQCRQLCVCVSHVARQLKLLRKMTQPQRGLPSAGRRRNDAQDCCVPSSS